MRIVKIETAFSKEKISTVITYEFQEHTTVRIFLPNKHKLTAAKHGSAVNKMIKSTFYHYHEWLSSYSINDLIKMLNKNLDYIGCSAK